MYSEKFPLTRCFIREMRLAWRSTQGDAKDLEAHPALLNKYDVSTYYHLDGI